MNEEKRRTKSLYVVDIVATYERERERERERCRQLA